MEYVQYVGQNKYYKVFVKVSNPYYKTGENRFDQYRNNEIVIKPIKESEYEYWVKKIPVAGRYEVRKENDVFIGDESHRDSYSFHIPGFKKIEELQIGEIIPLNGFRTEAFLSEGDKKLLNKEETVKSLRKQVKET